VLEPGETRESHVLNVRRRNMAVCQARSREAKALTETPVNRTLCDKLGLTTQKDRVDFTVRLKAPLVTKALLALLDQKLITDFDSACKAFGGA
jgi:hypothetical protein